jgi:hypothetical protein
MPGLRPFWPFGRAVLVPRAQPRQRTQCPQCASVGTINDVTCEWCGGIGYHDSDNPAPEGPRP